MISVYRENNKLIGIYEIYLSNEQRVVIIDIKNYILDSLLSELKKEGESDLFTYNIIQIKEDIEADLFGIKCGVIFEFVTNKELLEELKILTERLQIGL